MGNGCKLTTKEVVELGQKVHELIINSIIRDGKLNTGHLASVLAVAWKLNFAFAERDTGLKKTRDAFVHAFDYMSDVMIDGAWDEENQRVKP